MPQRQDYLILFLQFWLSFVSILDDFVDKIILDYSIFVVCEISRFWEFSWNFVIICGCF